MSRLGARLRVVVVAMALAVAVPVAAVGLEAAPPGASSCSGCHAIHAAGEGGVPSIHGRPSGEIVAAMAAFRIGQRPATVMNRIAPGFTDAETRAIADWLSRQRVRP